MPIYSNAYTPNECCFTNLKTHLERKHTKAYIQLWGATENGQELEPGVFWPGKNELGFWLAGTCRYVSLPVFHCEK